MAAMSDRPACYPSPPAALAVAPAERLPLLDVLTSPVPAGRFDSPRDHRHVLCLHVGDPVPVTYRAGRAERSGVRLHGQFCVVPADSSTRWQLSRPARSLLLRLEPSLWAEVAGLPALAPSIHVRDAQVERIGWMMQAEDRDDYPGGRLFADSLAAALAARLLALQGSKGRAALRGALPAWRLRRVVEYIEAHLDEELALAELARVAGYSLSHFKTLFTRAVGVPVHRFVLERRVERARVLLEEGRHGLSEVAFSAGFAHASHMARCVRRVLGVTPSQLAKARPAR
jgi:AraC family transcriptional regulator